MIRVIIADDQPLIRDGLKTILGLQKDIEVLSAAGNGAEALEAVKSLEPDVLLLDIRMPVMDGVECIKRIKERGLKTKVLMLTTFNDEEYIIEAIASGASGYLLKDMETHRLIEAIHDVVKGKMVMPENVAARLAEGLSRITQERHSENKVKILDMSEREMEIGRMMVQGFTNRQIASSLYISEGTARNYISGIYSKIGKNDRTQAVLYLKEQGIK